jgi:hypothetical protein
MNVIFQRYLVLLGMFSLSQLVALASSVSSTLLVISVTIAAASLNLRQSKT